MVVIEAYSTWNSVKYVRILSIMELLIILQDKPQLFKPGNKQALINELINLVYFKYTITIPPIPGTDQEEEIIQTVVHLDPPTMPIGYAQTVEELIRVPPPLHLNIPSAPVPIVKQVNGGNREGSSV
jgi:hypothetical protein